MVDGEGVDDDGGEDGNEIPLSGAESRINLTPETKIVVVVAALRITKESVLLGLRVFGVYMELLGIRGRKQKNSSKHEYPIAQGSIY